MAAQTFAPIFILLKQFFLVVTFITFIVIGFDYKSTTYFTYPPTIKAKEIEFP